MEDITNLIANVGFPITAWIITFVYMCRSNTMHKEEVDKLSESFNRLSDIMDVVKNLLQVRDNVDSKGN